MPVDVEETSGFFADRSLKGLNTSGVVQSLSPDPVGRNLYKVRDEDNSVEYAVRANTRSDAWHKVRQHKENGVYVNTGACTIQEAGKANGNAPEFSVTPLGE